MRNSIDMRCLLAAAIVISCAFALRAATVANVHVPLVEAAKNSDSATVRALLQKKTDVNAAEPDGTTALHWASYRDNLEMASLLLHAGAHVNAVTDLGVTPLWTASENGSAPMVRQLLDAGANPNLALLSGETPLMVASRSGHADAVEALLAKGANPNAHGTRGQTALMWAAAQMHPEVVKVLLAHHADLKLRSDTWSEVMAVPPHGYLGYNKAIPHGNDTALLFAARSGDLESAKLLVAAGADVNDEDAWGVSATTLAAHSGFTDLVLFLLDKGANASAAKAGFSALHEAIMRRDEKMVAALLDHGADPNDPLRTWTPTRRSSEDFHFEPMLVGATPFWLAARFTEPEVMKMLVKRGADPKFIHHADYVFTQNFGQEEKKETVSTLMAATGILRVSPWVEEPKEGREAAALETVKLLVDWGVDLNVVNTDGHTALDAAKAQRFNSVVSFLTEKGAKAGAAGAPAGLGRGTRPR